MLPDRLDLRGDGRGAAKLPNLVAATQYKPIGPHRQSHRPFESSYQCRKPDASDPGHEQLVGLVGGDHQRRAELLEHATKLSVWVYRNSTAVEAAGGGLAYLDLRGSSAAPRRAVDMKVLH